MSFQNLQISALLADYQSGARSPEAVIRRAYGLKPTKGLISTHGVLPACRSLDCVSVFAGNADDAARVLSAAMAPDPKDPLSREVPPSFWEPRTLQGLRVGIPKQEQLEFFGDDDAKRAFGKATEGLARRGAILVDFDFGPFREVANLPYSGAWVAERFAAVGAFLETEPQGADPTVSSIIRGGKQFTAVQAFEARYRLQALSKLAANFWKNADVMLLPTTGTAYTHQQINEDPVGYNSNLGYYTNFVNLLDLSGIALPAGFKPNGMPFGITLLGKAFDDLRLAGFAALLTDPKSHVGNTTEPVSNTRVFMDSLTQTHGAAPEAVLLAVVGAHLRGQPLNFQLSELGAAFVKQTTTGPDYELYALSGTTPPKPGLVRVAEGGASIEVEVFTMSIEAFGRFTALVPAPLGIGNVTLADGSCVKGFICEGFARATGENITRFGGWRAFQRSVQS